MCRHLVITLRWDDEHALQDAGQVFDPDNNFNSLVEKVADELMEYFEDRFVGPITIEVHPA